MIYLSMMTIAVVSFQWFFWGFSLTFSDTGSKFIGNLSMFFPTDFYSRAKLVTEHFGLKGVLEQPSIGSSKIPSIVFCVYQLMFAIITYVYTLLIDV